MKILKFGGSSVGSPEIIAEVKRIVENEPKPLVVVVSAFKGITDQIIKASNIAAQKDAAYAHEVEDMRKRHLEVIGLLVPESRKEVVDAHVNKMFDDFSELLFGVHILSDLTPKTLDHLLSYGERLSSFIISNIIKGAVCTDMRNFIRTDSRFGNAQVDFDITNALIKDSLGNLKGIALAPGFIAANENGDITTLGRGGSDYTAAIIAAALDSEILEIWTDVDGFMTADPRKVSKAYPIPGLSYLEAVELSHFGAKVIYTPTLYPAYKKNIPIKIKNTFNPSAPGTLISADSGNGSISPIKGVSSIEHIDLITLQGSGLPGVTGTSMRLFSALARENISVILITQASSEYSISIAIAPTDSDKAIKSLNEEFQIEVEYKKIIDINCEKNLSIIAIVGEKMRNTISQYA